jgi:DNA polymerase-3 subunit gamma/tau
MGEALYRKYRSKNLDEVVGQEHVTTTIRNALKAGKISHAYLLTGPRGTGKTSIARIIAHEVNELPYTDQPHLDIIEIDAASNRRIDEIRDIREKVRIAPTSAKYKVYIIDEVHMLTKEAFNALLKTLEEPPKHAIFILATTEVHKLPETIISRTQRFNLKPIETSTMKSHLKNLAQQEDIVIDDGALSLIAEHSNGGMRDAISMLDQLGSHSKDISARQVEDMLGIAPIQSIKKLNTLLNQGTPKELIDLLQRLEEQGVQAPQIAHQLAAQLRHDILEGNAKEGALPLIGQLLDVPSAPDPQKLLELILLDFVLQHSSPQNIPTSAETPEETATEAPVEEIEQEPLQEMKAVVIPEPIQSDELADNDTWEKILQAIRKRHNTLYGVVRMANPRIEKDQLTLYFDFPFHQKRMNETKNRELMQDVVKEVTGHQLTIVCTMSAKKSEPADTQAVQTPQNSDTLGTITDIFGGGEVLES